MKRTRIKKTIKLGTASNQSFELTATARKEREELNKSKDDARYTNRLLAVKSKRRKEFDKDYDKRAAEKAIDFIIEKQNANPKFETA